MHLAISRLMWFVGLWCAGVAIVGLVGYAIKLMLHG
jgi:preprotein translocase subunit Sss1